MDCEENMRQKVIQFGLLGLVGAVVTLTAGCTAQSSNPASDVDHTSESRQSARRHFLRAVEWQKKGDYESAMADYSRSISLDTTNPTSYNNRGFLKSAMGEYDKAIADYSEAIRLDSNYSDAYYNRGQSQYEKGESGKAIEDFTEAIRINPGHADVLSARGNANYHTGELDKAIADFDEAIRLYPNEARDYYYRGSAWNDKGEFDKAIADFSTAIRLDPEYADAYKRRGFASYRKREYDRAIADYTASIELDPNDHMVYFRRGRAWSQKYEFDREIVDYEAAVRLNPQEAIVSDSLAWLLATCSSEALRDGKRAVQLATVACELTEWKMDLPIATLAAAYAESGNFQEAIRRQQQAIDLVGDIDKTIYEQRLELYKSGRPYRQTPRIVLSEETRATVDGAEIGEPTDAREPE